jgi:hypothetical protein
MNKLAIMTIGAALALAVPVSVTAQAGNITATATVNSYFSEGAVQSLTFTAVDPGTPAAVDPVAGTGGTPGYMEFHYNANYRVTATTLPTTLSDGGSSTLSVSWLCGVSANTGVNPVSASACSQGDTVDADNTVTAMGSTVVWLGGTIANTNVLAGTYTGGITFTIAAF